MAAEDFLKRGDKFSSEFNMRRACSLIEPFSFKNEDLIEFAEAYHKAKIEAISDELLSLTVIEDNDYDKGRNSGLRDAIFILNKKLLKQ